MGNPGVLKAFYLGKSSHLVYGSYFLFKSELNVNLEYPYFEQISLLLFVKLISSEKREQPSLSPVEIYNLQCYLFYVGFF
jgi:hypothetical protein